MGVVRLVGDAEHRVVVGDCLDVVDRRLRVESEVETCLVRIGFRAAAQLASLQVLLSGPRGRNELRADDVDAWLEEKAEILATRTLRDLRPILKRSINRAQKRDKVKRNVVLLCDEIPVGQEGRPSKALTVGEAEAVLGAAEADDSTMGAYIAVSLLTGARTEEARPLEWSLVDLNGEPEAEPPIPPHIDVWRSVRAKGETKTRKSRRSLALPQRGVDALARQHQRQQAQRAAAGNRWQENNLVFASEAGTELDAANVRRGVRRILKAAGLDPREWTPRELRHSFVSLLSDSGVPIEVISALVGHNGTSVTEMIYRHQIRPVILHGAQAMDRFSPFRTLSHSVCHSERNQGRCAELRTGPDLRGPTRT